MVYVRLAQDWTAPDGTAHAAGAMVEVDAATLAELEADGTVSEDGGSDTDGWPGPSVSGGGKDGGGDADGWPGPS